MNDSDTLWERYKHEVELHRGYLDLVIKINIFYYAITGAVISFYFLHFKDEPLLIYALILPFVMSVAFAIFFYRSAMAADISQRYIEKITEEMKLDYFSAVGSVLSFLLRIFFWLFIVVASGLFILFIIHGGFCYVRE